MLQVFYVENIQQTSIPRRKGKLATLYIIRSHQRSPYESAYGIPPQPMQSKSCTLDRAK